MLHSVSIKISREVMHQKFIVTPLDKANGNVAVICERFYRLTFIKSDHQQSN